MIDSLIDFLTRLVKTWLVIILILVSCVTMSILLIKLTNLIIHVARYFYG